MKKFFEKTKDELMRKYNTQAIALIPTVLPLQDLNFNSPKPKDYINWVVSEAIVPFYENAVNLYETKNYVESAKEIESIQKVLDKLDTNYLEESLINKIATMYYIRARVVSEGAQNDPNHLLAKSLLVRALKFNGDLTDANELLKAIQLEEIPIRSLDSEETALN